MRRCLLIPQNARQKKARAARARNAAHPSSKLNELIAHGDLTRRDPEHPVERRLDRDRRAARDATPSS